jgi:hypothetical protein
MPIQLMLQLLLVTAGTTTALEAQVAHVVTVTPRDGAPTLRVTADVGSASAFRLSVEFVDPGSSADTKPASALDSPSLDSARAFANFTHVQAAEGSGIRTAFGELLISKAGLFTLKDSSGKVVAAAKSAPSLTTEFTGNKAVTMAVTGSKSGPGATGRRPCLVNGGWGPPFTWDPVDNFFAFAVSPWGFDPDYIHCYPASFDGDAAPLNGASVHAEDSCTTITHVVPFGNYSHEIPGTFMNNSGSSSECCEACNAHPECTAWVRGPQSECRLYSCVDQWVPPDVIGGQDGQYLSGGLENQCTDMPPPPETEKIGAYIHQAGWFGLGSRMDWYLAPTPGGGFDYTKALFDLTGAPAVPPLYGMGFMATYWGYKNMTEVENYMHQFRSRELPIDSFIMDYDWFGPNPCGAAINSGTPADPDGLQGGTNCGDYGYRDGWWNNVTFKQPDGSEVHCATPADVFAHFHAPPLNMHFGGIRKPRTYSNKNMTGAKGWLLPLASDVGEGGDINFNFSVPDMREWYTTTHAHFIKDGMDFWWNDEGETAWFTYLLWNEAQAKQWSTNKPNTRHFTINRSWQPGMQRYPAISWTGDGQSCTHEELLRGMMNGCPLTSCDLTSPDATTLVRQYQSAVFTPIMRVHMMQGTPRFPWFWPDAHAPDFAAHQQAFQMALEMRYTFLPFMYSLAHAAHRTGRPISHPASFAFPEECKSGSETTQCKAAETTYTVGSVLIPSDLGLAHTKQSPPPLENTSTATLPASTTWQRWNTTKAETGTVSIFSRVTVVRTQTDAQTEAALPWDR